MRNRTLIVPEKLLHVNMLLREISGILRRFPANSFAAGRWAGRTVDFSGIEPLSFGKALTNR
jgi:hypothetical protein